MQNMISEIWRAACLQQPWSSSGIGTGLEGAREECCSSFIRGGWRGTGGAADRGGGSAEQSASPQKLSQIRTYILVSQALRDGGSDCVRYSGWINDCLKTRHLLGCEETVVLTGMENEIPQDWDDVIVAVFEAEG